MRKKQGSREPEKKARDLAERAADTEEGDWASEQLKKIEALITKLERKIQEGEFRPTVSDFIRLLQLQRELAQERPREIIVRWVEPSETDDASVG